MRGQKLILVKGVYSLEKWTKPNPVMSTENCPVDISSVGHMIDGLKVSNKWAPISGSPIVNVSRVQGH